MISITHHAAEKVQEIASAEGLVGQGLRLRVVGGGCAGFQYDLYFEDKPTEMDEEFESNGVKMYIDPLSFQYLDGTEIDYVEGVHGSGFKFGNPNVTGSWGCGSSFQASPPLSCHPRVSKGPPADLPGGSFLLCPRRLCAPAALVRSSLLC